MIPSKSTRSYRMAPGVLAFGGGFAFIEASATLVSADAHFAYEDVINATLPMWSTLEGVAALRGAAEETGAREIVILGDIVHGPLMTETAARGVAAGLDSLRALAEVTLVAGNHEGRSRARDVLGETHEMIERGGWTLVHGDRPQFAGARTMIGHLHPSLRVGGASAAPVFLCGPGLIVVPALTTYSSGLDVLSRECAAALRRFGATPESIEVVAVSADRVYPFGNLAALRAAISALS